MNQTLRLGGLALTAGLLSACANQAPPASARAHMAAAPTSATVAAAAMAKELFVVLPDDGRMYAFGDAKNYFDYMNHGEVTLTRTHIGEGPGGKTLVFGITSADVKANVPSMGERVLSGEVAPAPDFYGEVFKDGRFYLFDDLKHMKEFAAFGEAPYSYTDVGVGPRGETLVCVMSRDGYKRGKPQARVDRFKAIRVAGK